MKDKDFNRAHALIKSRIWGADAVDDPKLADKMRLEALIEAILLLAEVTQTKP